MRRMRHSAPPATPVVPLLAGESLPSRASVGRFSLYLRRLEHFQSAGVQTVSSGQLGEALGIPDTQVRKDLAYLGKLGHRGVGYPTAELITALRAALGVDRSWAVILVGVGNLARALLRYRGFPQQGFHIVALIDKDPQKIGQQVEGLEIQPLKRLPAVVARTGAELALLTVPGEEAQSAAEALVAAGIRGILNFAPAVLRLPAQVRLVNVDLAVQLEQLAFLVHLDRHLGGRPAACPVG
jgi:redox-sensing transcriptional repressor